MWSIGTVRAPQVPMTHISIETNVPNNKATWLTAVTEEQYAEANKS